MAKPALLVIALLSLTLAVVGGLTSRGQESELKRLENSPEAGTLKWYAAVAKAKGDKQITFSAGIYRYVQVKDFDDALKHFAVIVGQPIERKSYGMDSRTITTWYRFRVLETISTRDNTSCVTCPQAPDPPSDLVTTSANEILVPKNGGSVMLDGIKLTSVEAEFPEFQSERQYLLFLGLNTSSRVGMLQLGPNGVLEVAGSRIHPFSNITPDRLATDIERRFGNSVEAVQIHVLKSPPR